MRHPPLFAANLLCAVLRRPEAPPWPAGCWRLDPGRALSLMPRRAGVLRIVQGRVWLTQNGSASPDVFLGPGEQWPCVAGQRLVIEPLALAGEPAQAVAFNWQWLPKRRAKGSFIDAFMSSISGRFRITGGSTDNRPADTPRCPLAPLQPTL